MKVCRFKHDDIIAGGIVEGQEVWECTSDLLKTGEFWIVDEVELLAPMMPSKIVCVGRNYSEHAKELGNEVPEEPLLFLKAPSSMIASGDEIVIPPQSQRVEHEGEMAIVIGRTCKNVNDEDDPLQFIFGYTCLNDVTARDLQKKDVQFARAKSFDTFCPIGPYIETDLDPSDVRIITRVNGEILQDGRTSQMVFPVEFLVRYISRQMTLNPGDVIATGTPSGVSQLLPGDICGVEVEGIGVLSNAISAA